MRIEAAAGFLVLVLSCSSAPGGSSGIANAGGLSGGGAAGSPGSLNVTPDRDCTAASDKVGCACMLVDEQRACQVGNCPGTQTCLSTGTGEVATPLWGACNASTLASGACSTADGAGGSSGGDGAGGSSGGGSTGDDAGGKGSTGDGAAGKGSTGDGLLPSLCTNHKINNEPEILAGYAPADGQSVSESGQIKVWVNDEGAPFISPGEKLDPNTGAVTTPGDHTAKAPDGYLWEPALYIAPDTAESGGTPHFPQMIKGWYSYPGKGKNAGILGAPADPVPGKTKLPEKYTAEDIWEVSQLGLPPGHYIAEFVVWDGDTDRAIGCIRIDITP
jgi:hypothetical protein